MTDTEIASAADELEHETPERVLAWSVERFGGRVTCATGFGPEGCVLIDIIAREQLPIGVFTIDTGLLFPETHDLWRRLERRYGLTIRAVRPAQGVEEQAVAWGPALWEHDPDRCCALRKVAPQREALDGFAAWISGLRRDQTPERAASRVVQRDRRLGLVKVNPLASWTSAQVWERLRARQVPVNALHARGYPSIGCRPCTTPVASGEPARAGRWRRFEKTECGLHLDRDGRAIALREVST